MEISTKPRIMITLKATRKSTTHTKASHFLLCSLVTHWKKTWKNLGQEGKQSMTGGILESGKQNVSPLIAIVENRPLSDCNRFCLSVSTTVCGSSVNVFHRSVIFKSLAHSQAFFSLSTYLTPSKQACKRENAEMAPSLTAVRPGLLLALAVLYTHATALALAAILEKMPGSQGSSECRQCTHHRRL